MQRSYPLFLFVALSFLVALAVVTRADAAPGPTPTKIMSAITATWRCQDQLGQSRTQTGIDWGRPSKLLPGRAYRAWALNMWIIRRTDCLETLHARGRVWRRLAEGLAGSPMAGTEKELEAAGRRHHVSPFFIAAIAATESSLGAAACGNYNAWGLGNCSGIWNVPAFRSWAEAYDYMGRFLASRWPNARTPYDYSGYAKCSSCWGSKTASHMRRLFGVAASVTY